jgi:hypothetical protein
VTEFPGGNFQIICLLLSEQQNRIITSKTVESLPELPEFRMPEIHFFHSQLSSFPDSLAAASNKQFRQDRGRM